MGNSPTPTVHNYKLQSNSVGHDGVAETRQNKRYGFPHLSNTQYKTDYLLIFFEQSLWILKMALSNPASIRSFPSIVLDASITDTLNAECGKPI